MSCCKETKNNCCGDFNVELNQTGNSFSLTVTSDDKERLESLQKLINCYKECCCCC